MGKHDEKVEGQSHEPTKEMRRYEWKKEKNHSFGNTTAKAIFTRRLRNRIE